MSEAQALYAFEHSGSPAHRDTRIYSNIISCSKPQHIVDKV